MTMVALEDENKLNWQEETASIIQGLCLEEHRSVYVLLPGFASTEVQNASVVLLLVYTNMWKRKLWICTWMWLPPTLALFA